MNSAIPKYFLLDIFTGPIDSNDFPDYSKMHFISWANSFLKSR
jgi:hypothetical protein